jgi:hypothetical protein
LFAVKPEGHQPLEQQVAQAEELSLFVSLETCRCLLQAVGLLSLAQVLDVTALQQTLEEPQPQDKLLVEHQASVDAHLEVIQQQVQDLLAQGRMDSVVTLVAERSQQDCSTTQTLVLVALVALVVEDNQTVTL